MLCVCPNPSVDMFVWIDQLHSGNVNRARREARFPGGKGVHVALAAAELGMPVRLLAFWGGATGEWIKSECWRRGIECYGPEVDGWSRTCMTFKSQDPEWTDTELLGTGPTIDEKDFNKFFAIYQDALEESQGVCFSGSWPGGAPADGYARMLAEAQRLGKATLLDTTGDQLKHALVYKPTVVHMNRSEAADFFGGDNVQSNARLLAQRCTYAAVTAGADGLFLFRGSEGVHTRCTVDRFFSAVGSGDCLLAGLAVSLLRGEGLVEMAKLAVACGGANCMREDLGMLYRGDVDNLLPKVEARTITFNT